MDRFTPAGVPIHDCDAFGWGMQGGMLQSPTYIAQRGYACGYRAGLASGGSGGGGGGGDTGWQKALDGEVMPVKPTVSESNAALKKVWRKLGGTVASCLAVLLSFGQTVQTAPLGTLNEDSAVVVRVDMPDISGEIAEASNNVLTAANDFTLKASNDVLTAANDFTLKASNDVLTAANDFTLKASNDVLAAANRYSDGLLDKVSTNGLRSVTDNVCHVTEPRLWFHGDVEWSGSTPRPLKDQPSFDEAGYRWTWLISGSEADGFSAAGGKDATDLSFAGMGLVSSTASFTAKLQEPTSVSNETFVTTSFVTNGVAEAGRNAFAAAMPNIRDLLAKTNATEITADFTDGSLVGRIANDSVGFDVREDTLVLVDGDTDVWSCKSGGGVDEDKVREVVTPMIAGATNGLRRLDDLGVYRTRVGRWEIDVELEYPLSLTDQPEFEIVEDGFKMAWYVYLQGSPELGAVGEFSRVQDVPFDDNVMNVELSGAGDVYMMTAVASRRVTSEEVDRLATTNSVASKRDLLDNVCHKSETTKWTPQDAPAGVTFTRNQPYYHDEQGRWFWDDDDYRTWAADGGPEDVEANFFNGSSSFTAVRFHSTSKDHLFVTDDFVTGRFGKIRAALESMPAGASVADLVNALKNALKE